MLLMVSSLCRVYGTRRPVTSDMLIIAVVSKCNVSFKENLRSSTFCCCSYVSLMLFMLHVTCPWSVIGVCSEKYFYKWEKRSEKTQTLRAVYSKAEPKIFAPPQTPFPGARDGQNLIKCRWSLPLLTNPVWWGSIHTISSYRGNRPTHPHTQTPTHPQTDRTDYNTLRRN